MDVTYTTSFVRRSRTGDSAAADALLPALYGELRSLAAAVFARQNPSHTLQPTALLHEAYVKMIDQTATGPADRAHFMRLAAKAMRQVLIDHARARNAAKRGGGRARQSSFDAESPAPLDRLDWLALDEAISRLAQLDKRQAAVVELRFFGGMSVAETAEALDVSPRTVELDWRMARAWLSQALGEDD